MIYRMFPYENNVVQIKVSYKEYQSILAECRKYCDKYKVALINELHKSHTSTTQLSCFEQIIKLKELLDCGAISENEFNEKKTELLKRI